MADGKTLKTRIALLYKSYQEWTSLQSTYVPLKGEVCFCEVPQAAGEVASEPCVLFKVGDGVETFENLPWGSALAADVYAWAKKEHLEWSDITNEFKEKIKELVGGEETNTLYKIEEVALDKWQLMKSEDKGVTWVNAEGTIDLTATIAAFEAELNKKVEKQLTGPNGKSYIFNENDGGGSKFEGNDGVVAYVGTHDNIGGEIGTQIYVDKADGSGSTIIDVTQNGAYYTKGAILPGAQRDVEDNELVTKKDIKDIAGAMHFVGVSSTDPETGVVTIDGQVYTGKAGDIVLYGTKEYICDKNGNWILVGDEGTYATKAQLEAEVEARGDADAALDTKIEAEIARAKAEENKKVNKELIGANGTAYIFNESDGGGARFVHNDGSESFVGVNDEGKDGMMAQIYADVQKGGKWSGSRINVYNNGIYYQSQADTDAGVNKNAAEIEIAVKRDVAARESVLLPSSAYGFNTNLRENQVVEGKALIDAVLENFEDGKRMVVVKAGEFRFNVTEVLDDSTVQDGFLGFACSGAFIDLATQQPYAESILFFYNPADGKTHSIYMNDKNHATITDLQNAINSLRGELADIAFSGNVNDLVQTAGDVLILDCNF